MTSTVQSGSEQVYLLFILRPCSPNADRSRAATHSLKTWAAQLVAARSSLTEMCVLFSNSVSHPPAMPLSRRRQLSHMKGNNAGCADKSSDVSVLRRANRIE